MLRTSWIVDLEFFRAARVGQFATFRAVRARLSASRDIDGLPLSLFLSSKPLVKPNSLLSHYVYAPLSPPFILPVSFSLSLSPSLFASASSSLVCSFNRPRRVTRRIIDIDTQYARSLQRGTV